MLAGPHLDDVAPFFSAEAKTVYLVPDVCVLELADVIRRVNAANPDASQFESASVLHDFRQLEPVVFGAMDLAEDALLLGPEIASYVGVYIVLAMKWEVPLCTLDTVQAEEAGRMGVRVLQPGAVGASNWPPLLMS